jgi:DNA mismatch repair ATPase MutS
LPRVITQKDLFIITGANQGGKSTFWRSIGLAQLMMQSGMFVPAETFTANVCDGLFTHYKREEDTTMTSGKLDEELSRMSEIIGHITPNALLLFNESFAATNEREGSEIAGQINRALLEKSLKVFFVTHLYEFAHRFYTKHLENAIFLRAERKANGTRTFKITEGEPLKTSFGVDVYHKVFDQPKGTDIETEEEMQKVPTD